MLRKLSFLMVAAVSVAAAATTVAAQEVPTRERGVFGSGVIASGIGGGYLGIQTQDISSDNFAKYGLSEVRGVAVTKVSEDSPAAKGGIRAGDVILKFNGEEVSSYRKLTRLIMETAPDHKVVLRVFRSGGEEEITVTVGKRDVTAFQTGGIGVENFPSAPQVMRIPRVPRAPLPNGELNSRGGFILRSAPRRQIGINTTVLSAQLADYFGISGTKGLLIDEVLADSPAAKAGLKAGDVIVEANGRQITSEIELIKIVSENTEGTVLMTVVRDKNRQTFTVKPKVVNGFVSPLIQSFDADDMPFDFEMLVPPTAPTAPTAPPAPAAPKAPEAKAPEAPKAPKAPGQIG